MNVSDIEFIHKLLIRQKATCKSAFEVAKAAMDEAKAKAAANAELLERLYDTARDEYDEVCQALRSFELKEWN